MWVAVKYYGKHLTKECDFEIANLYRKKIHNTLVNEYCIFKDQTQVYLFILVINDYISFIEIKNLIKNLFGLNCQ